MYSNDWHAKLTNFLDDLQYFRYCSYSEPNLIILITLPVSCDHLRKLLFPYKRIILETQNSIVCTDIFFALL
jgi:hypothetical protein